MPRGSKSKYTSKQKRKAEHIEEGYEKKGVSKGRAKAIGWATVNKTSGGGEKSGSGTRKSPCHSPGCTSLFVARRPLFERAMHNC